jgi:6-phosphogluconate dehydrogenase
MVGLGRMGANLLRRAMRAGIAGVGFDRDPATVAALAAEGATPAASLAELVARLAAPRTVWVMLPAGAATEACLSELHALLAPGDTIIEGGNSFWKDSARRASEAARLDLRYLDVGTSGGVWGLERGYCLMIGGSAAAVEAHEPLWAALCPGTGSAAPTHSRENRDPRPTEGRVHCGPSGAGHYAKMVHNGVEYGMMQAMAEGLDLLRGGPFPGLDLADITEAWRRGSVVSSWLLDLTAQALALDPQLSDYSGVVSDSGEGRWTVDTAVEHAVPVPVLAAALFARFRSRQEASFADKALSAMRKGFGGHLEPAAPDVVSGPQTPGVASSGLASPRGG